VTPVLAVEGLSVSFRQRSRRRIAAVVDVELCVARGESVALVGGSGAGKSTVARAVAGLVTPDRGRILLEGTDLVAASRTDARRRRQALHLVFQNPYASLPPTLRVADIVAEPLLIQRLGDHVERRDRVEQALTAVGLDPLGRYLRRYPHQLSGGERQRVAFARALVARPRLILADEPTQMLDASLRVQLTELIGELGAEHGVAVLHITHDLALAQRSCTRLVVMQAGRVVEQGRTVDVLGQPRHSYTAALVAAAARTRSRPGRTAWPASRS
jgi:peptide/nickel transport system ATP-binding protein